MIEAIMYFALGFLGASLIALVVLSAVWHRAVRLTTKRIEGAIPVSMSEIQADKDQLRAEFAMSTRRLENSVEQLKFKTTEQFAEIGRKSESIRLLKNEVEEKTAKIMALDAQERTLRDKLHSTEEELAAKSRMLSEAEAALAAKNTELANIERTLAGVNAESDSRQVEIVALTTQRDTLKERIETLELEIAATEHRLAEERDAAQAAADALSHEKNNVEDLSTRLREMEGMFAASKREAEALAENIEALKNEAHKAAGLAEQREQELQHRLAEREAELNGELRNAVELAEQREAEMELRFTQRLAELNEEARKASDVSEKRERELAVRLAEREAELHAHLAKREADLLAQSKSREADLERMLEKSEIQAMAQIAERESKLSSALDEIERNRAEARVMHDKIEQASASFHATIETLRAEKAQLEGAMNQMREERGKLDAELAHLRSEAEKSWAEERVENALLRERINDVAAEVARLVANMEGVDSPIERILAADAAQANGHHNGDAYGDSRVSLAQRIRNLQSRPR